MKKLKKRLVERYRILKKHPVTKGNEWAGLGRYIRFHVLALVFKRLTYKWIGDLKLSVSKGDAGLVGNIYYGLYEFEESIFLLHLLRSHDVFLDVGANLGHYSLLVSGLCLNKSIAIEPVPKTINNLKKQIALNRLEHLITVKHIGVAEKSGNLWFSTNRNTMDRIVNADYPDAVHVKVLPIDILLKGIIPIAIKIDVEGYELFALQGAKQTLSDNRLKIVILELNNSSKAYNVDDRDVYKLMIEYGFMPYRYEAMNRELILLLDYNHNQFNTLFVRDKSFVIKRLKVAKNINIRGRVF